ncbi:energy transducer TonB [Ichthyenterobacterium magnum]|uniref:Protein TonB n=1 Tax=Ichthyenterobacterium magnum TaxID=1230530 RepID=A0A420DXZ6_9FLAO|nr:energy transducer TonB [Ichthyenterobacterium magnum]RKE99093.1 protein TonB [Ichthyenterobacterium magnum]
MKNLKKTNSNAGQSNADVQKPQKHDVNLQKNSTLYFQVGLILCLLATYGLFEMNFESKNYNIAQVVPDDELTEINIENFKVYVEEVKKVDPIQPVQKLGDKDPIVKDDNFVETIKKTVISTTQKTDNIIDASKFTEVAKPVDPLPEIFDMRNVEVVPVYPGCEKEKTNKGRVKCMSTKLSKLVQRKFNTDIASDLGLSGKQKIDVQFKIDNTGKITEIKTRAPYTQLEKEAQRIAKKIPAMTPGMQRKKPVSVIYNLPIIFKVD